jgi:hypothetical protein
MHRRRLVASAWALTLTAGACSDDVTEIPDETGDSSTSDVTSEPTTSAPTTSADSTSTGDPTDATTTTDPTETTDATTTTGEPTCGNGAIDEREQCDGDDLDGASCESLELGTGTLACDDRCAFDASGCTMFTCGDGMQQGAEACDGRDLGGEDCISQGFETGVLLCADDCSALDATGCLAVPDCVELDIGSAVGPGAAAGDLFIEDPDFFPSCTGDLSPAAVLLWVAPADGTWIFDTAGSDFDVTLATYSGCGEANETACSYDWGGGIGAEVSLGLDAGDAVILQVSGTFGSTGNWVLNINALGAGEGGCCFATNQIGCADQTCQDDVCQALPQCCQFGWDAQCAGVAGVFCDVCNTPDICGNATTEAPEVCDGDDFGGETCQTQGFDGGALACAADCSGLDTSGCYDYDGPCCAGHGGLGCSDAACVDTVCQFQPWCCDFQWDFFCADVAQQVCDICNTPDICGNGVVDGTDVCDNPDFGGETCQSQGFDGGAIACEDDCSAIDISGCADFGGDCCLAHDGVGCDDATCTDQVCAQFPYCCEVEWDQTCEFLGQQYCGVCGAPPFCGNYLVDDGETCDFADTGGLTCADFGFDDGTLFCNFDCASFDTSNCFDDGEDCCVPHNGPSCADIECANTVCVSQPWCCDQSWDASCAAAAENQCQVCGAYGCGDPFIQPGDEVCDGNLLGGQTCASQGFDYGVLSCNDDCDSFDTSGCLEFTGDCCSATATPGCDNVACTAQVCASDPSCCNGPWDQGCADLANTVCVSCDPGACGNDAIELGETCDGADLDGQTCVGLGFDGGPLTCTADCGGIDASGCLDYDGDCCAADGTPGCDDNTCSNTVCEVDPTCCTDDWDANCVALAQSSCAACGYFYDFSGVQTNLPIEDLVGWRPCWVDNYSVSGAVLGVVRQLCSGENLLMGCRQVGSDTLTVAANAPRADVLFDTDASNVPHDANGVGWYYDESLSWGFAPEGAVIQRSPCDIVDSSFLGGTDGERRLCWRTVNNQLGQGFRCGEADSLVNDPGYERVMFERP